MVGEKDTRPKCPECGLPAVKALCQIKNGFCAECAHGHHWDYRRTSEEQRNYEENMKVLFPEKMEDKYWFR